MARQLDAMLARWTLLYPEITGASEQDDSSGETRRVKKELIVPLLLTDDINSAFDVAKEEYQRWRHSLPAEESDPETVLAQEARFDDTLAAFLEGHRDELGDQAVKAALESVKLRRIARDSVLPHREIWPEGSWERIGQTDDQQRSFPRGNPRTPGHRRRQQGQLGGTWQGGPSRPPWRPTTTTPGENGQDAVRLEDIPE